MKIDIGAVYNSRPKDRIATDKMDVVQRELVFDIDLTDYDEIRFCCKGAAICKKCWKFMAVACEIIDAALREDFGFTNILWIFSGRRGIHCWVCDYEARVLDTRGRTAIGEYLHLVTGNNLDEIRSKISLNSKLHHSIKRSNDILKSYFEEILLEQEWFSSEIGLEKILSLVSDVKVTQELREILRNVAGDSAKAWEELNKFISCQKTSGKSQGNNVYQFLIEELRIYLLYPRLDINVTKGLNHLLKSPFCVHPKTGKVCVPFNAAKAKSFDPDKVPSIDTLINEINEFNDTFNRDSTTESKIKEYKKTSLFKSILIFENFLKNSNASSKENSKNHHKSLEF